MVKLCIEYAVWYSEFSPLTLHWYSPNSNTFVKFKPVIVESVTICRASAKFGLAICMAYLSASSTCSHVKVTIFSFNNAPSVGARTRMFSPEISSTKTTSLQDIHKTSKQQTKIDFLILKTYNN